MHYSMVCKLVCKLVWYVNYFTPFPHNVSLGRLWSERQVSTRIVLVEDRGLGPLENSGSGTGGARGKRGKCKFSKATNFTIEKGLKGGRIALNLVPRAFSLRNWERQC